MQHAGHGSARAGADIGRGARDGTGHAHAAEADGRDIGDALRDQLAVGAMAPPGHAIGDEVLIVVAQRLLSAVRGGDLLARFGGDEFAILACHLAGPEAATSVALRVIQALESPISTGRLHHKVGAGIGIGSIFSALVSSIARNPASQGQIQVPALLGFALAEATGLFGLIVAFIILFT